MEKGKPSWSTRALVSLIRDGKVTSDCGEYNGRVFTSDQYKAAMNVIDSEKFVKDYIARNGTKSFLCERLRDGYIGQEIEGPKGSVTLRTARGKPFGTIVAIPTEKGVPVFGLTYISNDEDYAAPVVGLAIALRRAIEGQLSGKVGIEAGSVRNRAKLQALHFEKRAKAFFYPDHFSHSRGSDPVIYENYDEIHRNREIALEMAKAKETKDKWARK